MGEKLAKPPLIEAICEFHFAPDAWKPSTPDDLLARIGLEFSTMNEIDAPHLDERAGAIVNAKRWQYKRPDELAMVQIAPGRLAINQLRPYDKWEAFREMIADVFASWSNTISFEQVTRLGLRYINELGAPTRPSRVRDVLTVHPRLSGALERGLRDFYQRYVIDHADANAVLIHQTGLAPSRDGGTDRVIILDLQFVSTRGFAAANTGEMFAWLDAAHGRVHEAFVASLTTDFYERRKKGES